MKKMKSLSRLLVGCSMLPVLSMKAKSAINLHRYQCNASLELPSKALDGKRGILHHRSLWFSLAPTPFEELSGTHFLSTYLDSSVGVDQAQTRQLNLTPTNFYGFNLSYCMALSSKAFFGLHGTLRFTEDSKEVLKRKLKEDNNLLNIIMRKLAVDYGFQLGNEHLYVEVHYKLAVEKERGQSNAEIFNQTLIYDFELPKPRYYLHFNPYGLLKTFFSKNFIHIQQLVTDYTPHTIQTILFGIFEGVSFNLRGDGENFWRDAPDIVFKLNLCIYPKLARFIIPIALNLKGKCILPSAAGLALSYTPTSKELRRQILQNLKAPYFPKGMLRFQS